MKGGYDKGERRAKMTVKKTLKNLTGERPEKMPKWGAMIGKKKKEKKKKKRKKKTKKQEKKKKKKKEMGGGPSVLKNKLPSSPSATTEGAKGEQTGVNRQPEGRDTLAFFQTAKNRTEDIF